MGPSLIVVRRSQPETTQSPEFRYLVSWVLGEAKSIYGVVTELDENSAGGYAAPPGSQVLVLADDRVLLGRATLAAMAASVRQGANWVAPTALEQLGDAASSPIYTLRGFEKRERALLHARPADAKPVSHLPVSLWSAAAARRAGSDLRALLEPAPASEAAAGAGIPVGLYHRFVDYYGELRSDILPFVAAGVRDVLEIGCARGTTGRWLKERFGCRVVGVELNAEVAQQARAVLDEVHAGDVQDLSLAGQFDLILALELFEHLTEQERFLERMRALLRPAGTLLLSVPNVGHWAIVKDLLAGRWDYLPIGLLCYTHYRFFTRHTLENWLRRGGFEDFELRPQITELPAEIAALPVAGLDSASLAAKGFYVIARR